MISITERRTRLYIPVIRENNGISSTARHHRIGDWNLNLPEGLSERNGQPLISERIAWRAAHQLICQLGGRVAGWGCFDKIYRKFRICDVRSIPHSPTTQTIHSIVAMLDTLKLLRFCMKLVKFSKFTWVTRTFDLCGEFFFWKILKNEPLTIMTLEASELCAYFSNFHLPTICQSFPGCWLWWLTNLIRLTMSGAFTVQFRNFNVKDGIIPCPFTNVNWAVPKTKGGDRTRLFARNSLILREKTVGSRSTWYGKPPFNLEFCFRMRMSRASQSVLVSTPREGWFGSILPYPRVMRRVEGAGEPVSRQSGSAKVLAVTRLLLVTSTGHFLADVSRSCTGRCPCS